MLLAATDICVVAVSVALRTVQEASVRTVGFAVILAPTCIARSGVLSGVIVDVAARIGESLIAWPTGKLLTLLLLAGTCLAD